jgi:hypothetical protein
MAQSSVKKTVDVKLHDDTTGQTKVITVPAPEEYDDEEGDGAQLLEMDVGTIARVAVAIKKQVLCKKPKESVRDAFPEFAKQYPVFFDKCCDPTFSLEKLDFVLQQLDALRCNRMNKDKATDKLMEGLNNRYVDSVVEDLESKRKNPEGGGTEESKEDAAKRLRARLKKAKEQRTGNM